jgi:hypothetical protein
MRKFRKFCNFCSTPKHVTSCCPKYQDRRRYRGRDVRHVWEDSMISFSKYTNNPLSKNRSSEFIWCMKHALTRRFEIADSLHYSKFDHKHYISQETRLRLIKKIADRSSREVRRNLYKSLIIPMEKKLVKYLPKD